nr:putative transformer protein transcript B [Jadera haematoloma]
MVNMLRHGKDRTPSSRDPSPVSNKSIPLSARLMEDGESEGLQVFKGPEGEKPNFDPKELKKITVKIIRKTPQSIIPTLQRAIVDPATVVPVRRTVNHPFPHLC